MNKAVLLTLIAISSYALSYHLPGPSLTRIAPDRAEPGQKPLVTGFWGASGVLLILGPELGEMYGKSRYRIVEPYRAYVNFNEVLNMDPSLKKAGNDIEQRGYLRMVPRLWYGVRPEIPDRYVPSGWASYSGRFYRMAPRHPVPPKGWRIVSTRKKRVSLRLDFPNATHFGGGIRVTLREPKGWKLADIGLASSEEYVVGFGAAWDSPFSDWEGKKPPLSEGPRYSMNPVVLAEVVDVTYESLSSGERRNEATPTGWVEAAGHFFPIAGSKG